MTVTASSFKQNFPEFGDATAFPDSGIAFWISVAGIMLNANRWGTALDFGTQLFVAHNVALGARDKREAANANVPGVNFGPVASQSVGEVSEAYNASGAVEDGAGHWNLTTYGTRFIRLARMMGAGGLQIPPC